MLKNDKGKVACKKLNKHIYIQADVARLTKLSFAVKKIWKLNVNYWRIIVLTF